MAAQQNPQDIPEHELRAIEKILGALTDEMDHADDVRDALRALTDAATDLPEEYPFDMQDDLTELIDAARALAKKIDRVHQRLERWSQTPVPDAATIADVKFHELRDEGGA